MDPIAQMFSQIMNAKNAGKDSVVVSFSKLKMAILKIMLETKQILDFKEISDQDRKMIEIKLATDKFIVKKVSRPGRRVYSTSKNIPKVKTPKGFLIISTSEGVMKDEDARKKGLGGELIAEVSREF